jgi:hypothetical protein
MRIRILQLNHIAYLLNLMNIEDHLLWKVAEFNVSIIAEIVPFDARCGKRGNEQQFPLA